MKISIAAIVLCLGVASCVDVKIAFFDNKSQDGNAISKQLTVGNACTSCTGFGIRLTNSWESYLLSAPTSAKGTYSVVLYDNGFCTGSGTTVSTAWADFPGSLKDSVDSYKICPPGVTP
jgi:hypothetical protein